MHVKCVQVYHIHVIINICIYTYIYVTYHIIIHPIFDQIWNMECKVEIICFSYSFPCFCFAYALLRLLFFIEKTCLSLKSYPKPTPHIIKKQLHLSILIVM